MKKHILLTLALLIYAQIGFAMDDQDPNNGEKPAKKLRMQYEDDDFSFKDDPFGDLNLDDKETNLDVSPLLLTTVYNSPIINNGAQDNPAYTALRNALALHHEQHYTNNNSPIANNNNNNVAQESPIAQDNNNNNNIDIASALKNFKTGDKCPLCPDSDRIFERPILFEDHIEGRHKGRRFRCPKCLSTLYNALSGVSTHVAEKHSGAQYTSQEYRDAAIYINASQSNANVNVQRKTQKPPSFTHATLDLRTEEQKTQDMRKEKKQKSKKQSAIDHNAPINTIPEIARTVVVQATNNNAAPAQANAAPHIPAPQANEFSAHDRIQLSDGTYQCKNCDVIITSRESGWSNHLERFKKDGIWTCEKPGPCSFGCGTVLPDQATITSHKKNCPRNPAKEWSKLQQIFNRAKNYEKETAPQSKKHSKKDENNNNQPCCENCRVKFSSDSALKAHITLFKKDGSMTCEEPGPCSFRCDDTLFLPDQATITRHKNKCPQNPANIIITVEIPKNNGGKQ